MIGALTCRARSRRAVVFTAVIALLFQALAIGVESYIGAGTLASSHEGHSEHHRPVDPAPPGEAHPCGWCVLCGKLGIALGMPAAASGVLAPHPASTVRLVFAISDRGLDSTRATLPLGARAPPWLC
jgi:hypothetical protein